MLQPRKRSLQAGVLHLEERTSSATRSNQDNEQSSRQQKQKATATRCVTHTSIMTGQPGKITSRSPHSRSRWQLQRGGTFDDCCIGRRGGGGECGYCCAIACRWCRLPVWWTKVENNRLYSFVCSNVTPDPGKHPPHRPYAQGRTRRCWCVQ